MRSPCRLDSLRIVTPCTLPWSSMRGDDAVRFCARCHKNVYNVAALSEAEAVALVERAEGRVCLRLTRRPDGTVVTGDCWAALRRARQRGLLALAVAAPAIIAVTLWTQALGLRALLRFLRPSPAPVVATSPAPSQAPPPPPIEMGAPPPLPPIEMGEPPPSPRAVKKHRHATASAPPTTLLGRVAVLPRNERID
jgi:hypothetical protein